MNSVGRDPIVLDLTAPNALASLKDQPFKIKEGVKFNLTATFKVQHNILSGLHYVQIIKRKGIRVDKISEMIVCPSLLTHKFTIHFSTLPVLPNTVSH